MIVGEDGRTAVVAPDNVLFEGGADAIIRCKLWIYNLRTNKHFTLETGSLKREATWSAEPDAKANLDIFWLRDESLADSESLPPPAEIARKIIEDLEADLAQFRLIEMDLAAPDGDSVEMRTACRETSGHTSANLRNHRRMCACRGGRLRSMCRSTRIFVASLVASPCP